MNSTGIFILAISLVLMSSASLCASTDSESKTDIKRTYDLLPPSQDSEFSLEKCITKRRSIRGYADEPLSLQHISQILWAAQGITNDRGFRTTPSAGAKFPLEIFLVVSEIDDVLNGIYHYQPKNHSIKLVLDGDFRKELSIAALNQNCVLDAPVNIIITGVISRTAEKYGERAERYVHIEVGAACQNVYLQSETLGLGTVAVGAFHDGSIRDLIGLDDEYTPLLIMPLGKKSD